MKTNKDLAVVHPLLVECIKRIQRDIIDAHNLPMRLFETGRTRLRQHELVQAGKETSLTSSYIYDFDITPPLYCTAVSYVFFDKKWSWNLRDSTIMAWYQLFGNLVLDECPEIIWGGNYRKNTNYTVFRLRETAILQALSKIKCTLE